MIKIKNRYALGALLTICLISFMSGHCRISFDKDLPLENVVQIKVISTEIDWYTGELAEWQGTGVFIKDDLILTAGHVVEDASSITVVLSNGEEYFGNNWYQEIEADLGIIVVYTPKKELGLTFDDAVVGETVWALGNPYGVFPVLTKGIVSAINMSDSFSNTKSMLISDVAANSGNSGCPLVNQSGEIVGIFVWHYTFPATEGMNYFVRAEVCELMLNKYYAIKALEEVE